MKPLNSELQKCIDDCNACITAARICLDQHLGEPDMKKCHQFCLDCIALCIACVQLLSSQSDYSKRLCAIVRTYVKPAPMNVPSSIARFASNVRKNAMPVPRVVKKWQLNI
tara:strand:- start:5796 stop:6128 length:333 start_codon:yes stop_codon:yes gene_type:complete